MNRRFTLDGSDGLEARLEELCRRAAEGVRTVTPERELQALVLGGGYGRGEGGVLRNGTTEEPYNDLDFYVFRRGPRRWWSGQEAALERLGEHLSDGAGLHVEFKLDALETFRRRPVSMFSYDLVSGHRIVLGDEGVFAGCNAHSNAQAIPLSEAARLLLNRCSGLLLAAEKLRNEAPSEADLDFANRNISKARLALGDAVLAARGLYHWSSRYRATLLSALPGSAAMPWLEEVRQHHAAGLEFKLHPSRPRKAPGETTDAVTSRLAADHRAVSDVALGVWLWLENQRLGRRFTSVSDYVLDSARKGSETSAGRSFLLTLRALGLRAAWNEFAWRYPRERLLNTLPLLLWERQRLSEPRVLRHLRRQLRPRSDAWPEQLAAYERLRRRFG